jgi:hypothetical protein
VKVLTMIVNSILTMEYGGLAPLGTEPLQVFGQ